MTYKGWYAIKPNQPNLSIRADSTDFADSLSLSLSLSSSVPIIHRPW